MNRSIKPPVIFFVTVMFLFFFLGIVCGDSIEKTGETFESVSTEGNDKKVSHSQELSIADCMIAALAGNYQLKEANEARIKAELEYYNRINEKLKLAVGGVSLLAKDKGIKLSQEISGKGELAYMAPSGEKVTLEMHAGRSFLHPFTGHGVNVEYRLPFMRGRGRSVAWQDICEADRSMTTADIQYFLLKQEISYSVIKSYFNILLSHKLVELNQVYLENSTENLELTRKKFKEGLVPRIDLSRSELMLVNSENSLKISEKRSKDLKDGILITMGLDPRKEIATSYDIPYTPSSVDEGDCIEIALKKRQELLLDETNIKRISDELEIARNRRKPRLDFVARAGNSLNISEGAHDYRSMHSAGWSTVLEYYTELNRARLDSDIKTSERELLLGKEKIEERKRLIVKEIRDCIRSLHLVESTVLNKGENVKLAEEKLKLARRSWEEGLINNKEMVEARSELMQANSELIAAKIEYIVAHYALQKAMGYDLADIIISSALPAKDEKDNKE